MSHRRSPIISRKVVPIKRFEDEPLTRRDIQYDLLRRIFSDPCAVFTNPWPDSRGAFPERLTFGELYIKTILNSAKATKNFRDRLRESNEFAEDFAMLALLVNTGRINTTMSCTYNFFIASRSDLTVYIYIVFPEMKTTLRSYHPVPALQRTSGNLQDAPRIKHILKAATVEGEPATPPRLPVDILSRLVCIAPYPVHRFIKSTLRTLVLFRPQLLSISFLASSIIPAYVKSVFLVH